MTATKRWLMPGIFGLVVLLGGLMVLISTPSQTNLPRPAPDFILPDLNGQAVRLSQHKGKVVLLNVWATWCGPCRQEMPTMQALAQRLKGEDFIMLAASQDVDGATTVGPYLKEGGYTFPVLLDMRGEVGKKYGVTGYPETFIIDRQGQIVYHHIGYNNWVQPRVETALRRLIQHGVWAVDAGARPYGEHTPLRP
jgi:thiol-disulfide isomerase/thioredoxin